MSWNMRDLTFDAMRVWNYMMWSWLDLMRAPWMSAWESAYPGSMGAPSGWPPAPPGPWTPPGGGFTPPPFGGSAPPPFGGSAPPPFGGPSEPYSTEARHQSSEGVTVHGLEVAVMVEPHADYRRTAEVKVELLPGANLSRLVVGDLLVIGDPSRPALKGVRIARTGINSAQCLVTIPAVQEAGTYEGNIFEPMAYQPMTYEPVTPKVSGFVRVRIVELDRANPSGNATAQATGSQ